MSRWRSRIERVEVFVLIGFMGMGCVVGNYRLWGEDFVNSVGIIGFYYMEKNKFGFLF